MLTLTIEQVRTLFDEVISETELHLFYAIKTNQACRHDLLSQLDVLETLGDKLRGRIDRITAGE